MHKQYKLQRTMNAIISLKGLRESHIYLEHKEKLVELSVS